MATNKVYTHENDFHCPDDVHGRGQGYAGVEEHPDRSPALRAQRSGYQEVRTAGRHHSVRGYGAHRDGRQHRLKQRKHVCCTGRVGGRDIGLFFKNGAGEIGGENLFGGVSKKNLEKKLVHEFEST